MSNRRRKNLTEGNHCPTFIFYRKKKINKKKSVEKVLTDGNQSSSIYFGNFSTLVNSYPSASTQ